MKIQFCLESDMVNYDIRSEDFGAIYVKITITHRNRKLKEIHFQSNQT